jgi:Spy/CpxP family protein refolding chaperone
MENKKAILKTALVLVMLFIIGFLAGVGSTISIWRAAKRTMPFMGNPIQTLSFLTKELGLTEKQHADIEQIIKQTRTDLMSVRKEVQPRIRQRLQQAQQQIAALLNEEQRRQFNALIERRKARARKMLKRFSPWEDENPPGEAQQ